MKEKKYFAYGEKEIAFLKSKDAVLGKFMDEVGPIEREIIPDVFTALIHAIIGQQISTKAQATVWGRFQSICCPFTAQNIHSIPAQTIQSCGMTMKKALYIKDISANIVAGSLDLACLEALDDKALCARLKQIKGIGVWTAEMLMIFSMQRLDVLSWDDLAIQRGLRILYGHRTITPKLFAKYKKRYSPYSTIASLYLWKISECDAGPKKKSQTFPCSLLPAQK